MQDVVSIEKVMQAKGHHFPGGKYRIEHWENFLLTACTGADLMAEGVVHPVALFHVPILGAGTTIAEMFTLGYAESDMSVSIESYDWHLFEPIREDVFYTISGNISDVDRVTVEHRVYDRVVFHFNLKLPDGQEAARSTIVWHFNRRAS